MRSFEPNEDEVDDIVALSTDTQVIISTHSTYVLNKLSLKRVVLLQNGITMSFSDLADDTVEYFEKMPGYDTLRLILSKRVFLVEGPSDELIIQKLYKQKHGKLPIENGVDSVAFLYDDKAYMDVFSLYDTI